MRFIFLLTTAFILSTQLSAHGDQIIIALGDGQLDPAGVRFFDHAGSPLGPLFQTSAVRDVSFGPNGNLFVLANGTVVEMNTTGVISNSFEASGYSSIDVSATGIIALGDGQLEQTGIRFFDLTGSPLGPLVHTSAVNDVAFGPNGHLYALAGGSVFEMNASGSISSSFEASGYSSIDVSSGGIIALGDGQPDPAGVRFFNQSGAALGPLFQTSAVTDLAFAPNGNLFVLINGGTVSEMNTAGTILTTFGASGYNSIAVLPEPAVVMIWFGLIGFCTRHMKRPLTAGEGS